MLFIAISRLLSLDSTFDHGFPCHSHPLPRPSFETPHGFHSMHYFHFLSHCSLGSVFSWPYRRQRAMACASCATARSAELACIGWTKTTLHPTFAKMNRTSRNGWKRMTCIWHVMTFSWHFPTSLSMMICRWSSWFAAVRFVPLAACSRDSSRTCAASSVVSSIRTTFTEWLKRERESK